MNSEPEPSRRALRERAVSAMYVGVSGLRQAIRAKDTAAGAEAATFMRRTWSDIQDGKKLAPRFLDRCVDQYEVNAARRVSITESVFGDRKRGLGVGVKAVALAFASESPALDTATPGFSRGLRLREKGKALVGGLAALGIAGLATPKAGRRRQFALGLADKIV